MRLLYQQITTNDRMHHAEENDVSLKYWIEFLVSDARNTSVAVKQE